MSIFMIGPYFDGAAAFENRTAARKFYCLIDVACFNQRESADEILGLCERPVRHGLLLAAHDFAGPLERLTSILQWPLLSSSFIHAIHRCMLCWARSGVPMFSCRAASVIR
jgi:hypothetical protein